MRKDQPYISEKTRWSFFGAVPRIRRVRGGAVAPGGSVLPPRRTRVAQAVLQIEDARIWARMTFRSVRITRERFILALIEDLDKRKERNSC